MEFGLSEEQVLLQDSVNRFLRDQVSLDRVRSYAGNLEDSAQDIWNGLSELGIPGLIVEENLGGVGLGMLDAVVIAERLGNYLVPAPFLGTAVMAPLALALAGTQEDILRSIAAGETTVGVAFGEAVGARADAATTFANGVLNGKAIFVIDYMADYVLVGTNSKQIVLVDGTAEGISKQAPTTVERTRRTGELNFTNTPAISLTTTEEDFNKVVNAGRVVLAADTLGAAQNMLDQSVAYSLQREQFNRVIGSFQAVKHMCAEMVADLEPSKSLVWYAAHTLDHIPEESHLMSCHAKAHVSEVGRSVSKTATEVHGGMGFTDLVGLHYWFKRIGFNRQMLGSPEMLREEAAVVQGLV